MTVSSFLPWEPDGQNNGGRAHDGGSPDAASSAQRILDQRAHEYARAPDMGLQGTRTDVLVFCLGEEQYAVEVRLLRAVVSAAGLTPVPCTPSFVAGVINVRGEIITVIDLATALDLSGPQLTQTGQVLLCDLPQGPVGLLVTQVLDHRSLIVDALERPLSSRDFVWGIVDARIGLLRLDILFKDDRYDVAEDVP